MSKTLTKKELNQCKYRFLLTYQASWNYERMQGLGFLNAMLPAIRKIYKDDPENQKKSLDAHNQFFNTAPFAADLLLGMDIAIEEQGGENAIEMSSSIKTGLMGPLAGVFDPIYWAIPGTVFGAIAAYMAINDNALGIFLWLIWGAVTVLIRLKCFDFGYHQGQKLVTSMQSTTLAITKAAGVLGVTVVGALIASVVKINVPYTFISGDVSMPVQPILDSIMPYLLPVLFTAGAYLLIRKKIVKATGLIMIIIVLGIVGAYLGLLG